nr:MAG TPA: hypothetical protein [Caudoviricetes sp.]
MIFSFFIKLLSDYLFNILSQETSIFFTICISIFNLITLLKLDLSRSYESSFMLLCLVNNRTVIRFFIVEKICYIFFNVYPPFGADYLYRP